MSMIYFMGISLCRHKFYKFCSSDFYATTHHPHPIIFYASHAHVARWFNALQYTCIGISNISSFFFLEAPWSNVNLHCHMVSLA